MDKKKLTKKSIDIESEFVGLPVAPRKKKEKKEDMTDHIKEFLSKEITFESIKFILLKMGRMANDRQPSKMSIYYVEKGRKLNENLENHSDKLEYVGEMLDELGKEIYKYRKVEERKI